MALNWAPAQGAVNCTGSITPGARALYAWGIETYPTTGTMGIYNCRTVRGGSTTSLHGEGRAWDQGIPLLNGRANPLGHEIIHRVGQFGIRLGIQRAIFNRKLYDANNPNGRYYGGVHPHDDHIHWELTWNSARNLTLATLRAVLGTSTPSIGGTPMLGLRAGDGGEGNPRYDEVRALQACIVKAGGELPEYGIDGHWGDETTAGLSQVIGGPANALGPARYARLLAALGGEGSQGPKGDPGPPGPKGDPGSAELDLDAMDERYVLKFGQGGSGSELPEHRHGLRNSTGHVVRES